MNQTNSASEAPADIPVTEAPVEVAAPVPTPPPAPAPQMPRKLDETDIAKLENAFLKIDNLRKAKDISQRDIQNADLQIQILQGQLTAYRESLSVKYGVDLAKARITPDGTILPNAAQSPVSPTHQAQNPIASALLAGRN
jgi:hypothetical protein